MKLIDEFRATLSGREYNRERLVRQSAVVVQLARPDTSDEDAERIGRTVSGLILSELRWLDVNDGVNNARN